MPSLGITRNEVYGDLALVLGVNRDPDIWAADTNLLADVERIWRSGRRKFLGAYDWSFLYQDFPFSTTAPQTTGTVEATAGVVDLTGTTWPLAVVEEYLLSVGGEVYEVDVRNTATQITLKDTSVEIDSLTEYALYRVNYPLPANFGGFRGPVSVENNNRAYPNTQLNEAAVFPDYQIRALQNHSVARTGKPTLFSTSQIITDEAVGTLAWYVSLYPLPDAQYVIKAAISIQLEDALDSDGDDEICHPAFAECLKAAILSAAEIMYNGQAGVHTQRFNELLPETIKKDQRMLGATRIIDPRNVDRGKPGWEYRHATVDWSSAEV